MRILAVCGSLQETSSNLTLLRRAAELAPDGAEVVLFDGVRDLPLFNPDIERDGAELAPVTVWRAAVADADALLIATPEYGHSLPGALKNAIDWMIGSGELEHKIVGVTAAVVHEARGRRGLEALLGTLAAVGARIVGGVGIVIGPHADRDIRALLGGLVEAASSR